MHAVYLYRFLNVAVASMLQLHQWRLTIEVRSLIQKRYAQKPKNPV